VKLLSLTLVMVACSAPDPASHADGGDDTVADGGDDTSSDGGDDTSSDGGTDTVADGGADPSPDASTDLSPDSHAPDGPWLPLQLNDVSILFPMSSNPSDLAAGYLGPDAHGPRGTLLPEPLYDRIGHITGSSGNPVPGGTGEARYATLKVVALRIDPCFAALNPDPHGVECKNQLRLVFQEVAAKADGRASAFDSALHAFYTLGREELLAMAQAVAGLRVASSGNQRLGGLAPHPLMVREGLTGPAATGTRDLIVKYAGQQNLIRVTRFSSSNAGFNWAFDGFDVSSASPPTVTPMNIATLTPSKNSQLFFRGFGSEVTGKFTPATTSADDLTPLANVETALQLTPAARSAAFAALVRIENPTLHSPDTIDCASCHLATPLSLVVAGPKFSLRESDDPRAFAPDGQSVLPSEMAPSFDLDGGFNLHAFSYAARSPGINQRTVNETAAVVAYLNGLPR
jgi:hypothetical protein